MKRVALQRIIQLIFTLDNDAKQSDPVSLTLQLLAPFNGARLFVNFRPSNWIKYAIRIFQLRVVYLLPALRP